MLRLMLAAAGDRRGARGCSREEKKASESRS
eukprot:COSAG03_NODE_26602_length_258_cov_0.647799_1_plen_30_part_01